MANAPLADQQRAFRRAAEGARAAGPIVAGAAFVVDPRGILNPGKLIEPFEVWHHTPVEVRRPWDKH